MENEEYWDRVSNSVLGYYENGLPSLDEEKGRYSSLQHCAWMCVWEAFNLLMAEKNEPFAKQLLQHAVDAANLALECGDYERLFYRMKQDQDKDGRMRVYEDETFKPTKKHKQIEELSGRMYCYKSLYYANWLKNNDRDRLIMKEAVRYHQEVYDLYWHSPYSAPTIQELVSDYIEAGDYSTAMQTYQTKYRKAIKGSSIPKNYIQGGLHVLYLYSLYVMGDQLLLGSVQKGLDYWIKQCHHWATEGTWLHVYYPPWTKMTWAYLYCSLTGSTDINNVLQSIRG